MDQFGDLSIDCLNCSGGRVGRRIQAQRFDRIHQTEQSPESKTKVSHHRKQQHVRMRQSAQLD